MQLPVPPLLTASAELKRILAIYKLIYWDSSKTYSTLSSDMSMQRARTSTMEAGDSSRSPQYHDTTAAYALPNEYSPDLFTSLSQSY